MEACKHIDTEEDDNGVIRCVQQGGCGQIVGRVATKAMANAAFKYLREQQIGRGDEISNLEMRGLIDAAMAVQPLT